MGIGDYVRTNLRNEIVIRKVIDIIHDTSVNDNRMVFDKPTKFTYYVEDNENYKSSPQIIDLIEVGDYVNGYRVDFTNITEKLSYEDKCIGFYDGDGDINLFEEEIKSIVTHEQFESIEYRVEE